MDQKQRREILGAVGMAAGFGLAGCSSDLIGGGDNNSDGDSSGDNGETDTATPQCADTGIVVEDPDGSTHCVAAVESDQSIEEYYGFDTETQNSSALVDGIEVTDATISFVYRNTTTGDRSLVVVHDSPDGGTGGDAVMTFQGIDGTEWRVKDDPEPRSSSEAYEVPGETDDDSISAVWGWSGDTSLTDGGALGPLGESFDITLTHHQEGTARETTSSREGIDRWLFVDGADSGDPIELAEFTDDDASDESIRLSTTDAGGGDTDGDKEDGDESDDDGGTESGDDSTATDTDTDQETSTREISGEVSNDLTGFEVVEHAGEVGEDSFTGFLTLRNAGDETANVVYHELEFDLFDDEDSLLGDVSSIKIPSGTSNREVPPGETVELEFFPGSSVDIDFSQIASYEVVLTCSVADRGVYCPDD